MNEKEQIAAQELARVVTDYVLVCQMADPDDPEVTEQLPAVRKELAAWCRTWMEAAGET